jgi:hypothetical protein
MVTPEAGRFTPERGVLGAEQHDIGWGRVDLQPRYNPATGLPRDFHESTTAEHLAIWRDAPDLLATQSLLASLAVSLHGSALTELRLGKTRREEAAPLQEHLARERARQASLGRGLGIGAERRAWLRELMWTWDSLSLALCEERAECLLEQVPSVDGPLDVRLARLSASGPYVLDPWPFAPAALTVRCEARRLARRYEGAEELSSAFATAPVQTLSFTLSS